MKRFVIDSYICINNRIRDNCADAGWEMRDNKKITWNLFNKCIIEYKLTNVLKQTSLNDVSIQDNQPNVRSKMT